uniref:Pentatricopeptide repeat-containing protein n=1 Tax=Ananas comosus var. bracteatus TaxID=296719 RepID=A0A6V7QZE6_ANACO
MKTPPEIDAFNKLLDALCKFRDPKKAMKVLEEMLERGHTPENFTYNAAIDSFCSARMVSEARELFEFMRTKGSTISSPTAKTYSIMIIALAKYDMVEESFRLLGDMRTSGCLPDVSTYKEMIEGMCLAGLIDAAYKVLDEMGTTGFPPDILTYNEPDKAIDVWLEMDKRGCERVVDSYGIMIDGLFDSGRVDNACFLLEEVMDRGLKLPYKQFDGILLRLSAIGNLNAIHRVSEHMRKFYNVAMARRLPSVVVPTFCLLYDFSIIAWRDNEADKIARATTKVLLSEAAQTGFLRPSFLVFSSTSSRNSRSRSSLLELLPVCAFNLSNT